MRAQRCSVAPTYSLLCVRSPRGLRKLVFTIAAGIAIAVVALNWTYGRLPAEPQADRLVHPGREAANPLHRTPRNGHARRAHPRPARHSRGLGRRDAAAGRASHDRDRPSRLRLLDAAATCRSTASWKSIHELLASSTWRDRSSSGIPTAGPSRWASPSAIPATCAGWCSWTRPPPGRKSERFTDAQAHLVKFLQLPVIRQIANATFGQLLITVSVEPGRRRSVSPAAGRGRASPARAGDQHDPRQPGSVVGRDPGLQRCDRADRQGTERASRLRPW